MNSQLSFTILSGMDKPAHNPICDGQALQLLEELISLCYFWMYHLNAMFCYTVAVYLQHLKKITRPNYYLFGFYFSA